MTAVRPRVLLLIPLLAVLGAAPTGAQGPAPKDSGEKWVAPAEESARANPEPGTEAVRRKGAVLYKENCAMCHGNSGKGDGPQARLHATRAKPPEDLTTPAIQARMTDGEIFWKITTGWRSGKRVIMPRFGEKIPAAADRWAVVHHVRALGEAKK